MPRFFSQVRDQATLKSMSSPKAVQGATENLTEVLYDTQELTATTTRLTFFTAANKNNGFLTNMEQAGMIPIEQWFGAYILAVELLGLPPLYAAGTTAKDIYDVLHGDTVANGAPIISWRIGTNQYPQSGGIPLYWCYSDTAIFAATTQATSEITAGTPNMGWQLGTLPSGDPVVVIPGQRQFSFEIQWPNALAALGTYPYVRVSLLGTLYRGVGA